MKYIKTYENKTKYKIGDWVFLDNWWSGQHLRNFIDTHPAKIVGSPTINRYDMEYLSNPKIDIYGKPYVGKWELDDFDEKRIIRLATEEEIEMEIIKNSSKKYNL